MRLARRQGDDQGPRGDGRALRLGYGASWYLTGWEVGTVENRFMGVEGVK
jgi:hypothetical protein